MSENIQDLYVRLPPIERTSNLYFVDDPDVGWKRISIRRCDGIAGGKIRVPEWAGKTLRCACTIVEVDGRKVKGLCHVMISTWKIGVDGFADSDTASGPSAGHRKRANRKSAHQPETTPTLEDILAIKRCLGLGAG